MAYVNEADIRDYGDGYLNVTYYDLCEFQNDLVEDDEELYQQVLGYAIAVMQQIDEDMQGQSSRYALAVLAQLARDATYSVWYTLNMYKDMAEQEAQDDGSRGTEGENRYLGERSEGQEPQDQGAQQGDL